MEMMDKITAMDVLAPAPSIRPADQKSDNSGSEARSRRRSRQEVDEESGQSGDPGESNEHQLDRLA